MTRTETPSSGGGASALTAWLAGGVFVLLALQVFAIWDSRAAAERTKTAMADLEAMAAKLEKASLKMESMDRRMAELERLMTVADDWDFVVDEIVRTRTRVDDIIIALENRGEQLGEEINQPPDLDWTQPELFDAAKRAAEQVGIELRPDEVRVPARLVLKSGVLEYLACLEGGKLHESLVELIGNGGSEETRRHKQFGARLNNALQAIGFTRGEPIRFSRGGTRPAQGAPVYLFIEWEEEGKPVTVRAEDLVWNHVESRPMERGAWVYVGSRFVEGMDEGEIVYAADLTAEAVATYSSPTTIIDTTAVGAQDDTVFIVATPRLPEGVIDCTFVLRKEDKAPSREFTLPEDE